MILAAVKEGPLYQTQLTFAMARHVAVDLALVFKTPPQPPLPDRLVNGHSSGDRRQDGPVETLLRFVEHGLAARLARMRMLAFPGGLQLREFLLALFQAPPPRLLVGLVNVPLVEPDAAHHVAALGERHGDLAADAVAGAADHRELSSGIHG